MTTSTGVVANGVTILKCFDTALTVKRSDLFARLSKLTQIIGVAAAVLLSPSVVDAQGTAGELSSGGMDLHLFRPAVDSRGHITVNGSEVLPHLGIAGGLVIDYGFNTFPLSAYENNPDGREIEATHLVQHALTGTLSLNFGLFDFLMIGAQLPIGFMEGQNISVPNGPGSAEGHNVVGFAQQGRGLSYQGVNNIGLVVKGRILRSNRDPIGLAAIVRAELPTGNASKYSGEPGFTLWPSVVAEWLPVNEFRTSLEVGYRFNSGDGGTLPFKGETCPGNREDMTDNSIPPTSCAATNDSRQGNAFLRDTGTPITHDDLLTFGMGLSWRVAPVMDLMLEGYGSANVSEFGNDGFLSLEAVLGAKIFVQRHSFLFFGAGGGVPPDLGYQQAMVRGFLGFVYEPTIGDRDGDGYKDDVDACPDEPEDFDDFADEDGCPDLDNDRDGILDVDDSCPLIPEDRDGEEDEDGCPEGSEGDRDGDGIPDDIDACPDEPEDLDGFQDEDGCPDYDNDQDGIADVDDSCPNSPEDKDGFEDEDGCPEPDNDGDRIVDVEDQCPLEPETYNDTDDEDGCPDKGLTVISGNDVVILKKIYFNTDSAVIKQESYDVVDAVAATLNGNPQFTKIEVQGHADERGNDEYNIKLTKDRAAAVVEALVQRGVPRERLRSRGVGERCPVDTRSKPEAWDKNRRVQFKIVETELGPTDGEIVCPAGADLRPTDA